MKAKAKHLKTKSKNRKRNERFAIPQKILLIVFVCVFLYSTITLVNWFIGTVKTDNKYKDLSEKVVKEDSINKQPDESGNKESIINFEELKKINEDIIGWIRIENTSINYPIVQYTDNDYYLKKDIYKEYDACGSVFMDYKNNKKFTDKNNVLYGHNIKSGIMFADLVKIYENKLTEGKDNNIDIHIYTETMERIYKVFSSYKTEPEDYSIDTSVTENEYKEFIENLKNRSETDYNIDPKQSSQILTLSTCDNTGKKRILVHAKLDKIYATDVGDTQIHPD